MYCSFLFAYSIRDHKNKNISSINLFLYEYYNIGDSVVILRLRISLILVGIISIVSFSCRKNSLKKGYTEMVGFFYFETL